MANIISQGSWIRSKGYSDLPIKTQKKYYDEYVASTLTEITSSALTDSVSYRYREFLKKILIYITQTDVDNQRFLKNVNFNNKNDVSLILPYYVKRIKDISLYFKNKRTEMTNVKHKLNLDGSEEGFKRFIKRFILTLVSDGSFVSKFPVGTVPSFDVISKNTVIDVQPLYDLTSNYHNKLEDAVEAIIFLDDSFKESIAKVLKQYPIYATDKNTGKYINSSKNKRLKFNIKRTDYTQLPAHHFVHGDKVIDNIQFAYEKEKAEAYAGTDYMYLSSDGSSYKFDELFSAKQPHRNIPNQNHPTIAFSNKSQALSTLNQIGGFFKPTRFGVSVLHSENLSYTVNASGLSANQIVAMPNPSQYGDINYTNTINWQEDYSWLKADRSNGFIVGDIYEHQGIQKLYPYQSREETLKLGIQGISRAEDPVDFWVGDNKTVWSNSDIYPIHALSGYDIAGKQASLLISDKTVYSWQIDSFGNEFALYKDTQPTKQTVSQKSNTHTLDTAAQLSIKGDPALFEYKGEHDLDGDLFKQAPTTLYAHQYSLGNTVYESSTNSIAKEKSLLTKDNIYGDIYFRNNISSVIAGLSSMHSTLFIKYINDPDIMDELTNNIVDMDVFGDVIVIRTENYLVIEKYLLDDVTGRLKAAPTPKIFFSVDKSLSHIEQIGKPWYYEEKNELFVVKTVLHPHLSGSNFKIVFPEITTVNLNNLHLTKSFPGRDIIADDIHKKPFKTYKAMAEKNMSLLDTGVSINLIKYGNPQISFNRGTKTYAITYTAFDESGMSYLNSFWFRKQGSTFFIVRSALLQPDKTVFSANFTDFKDLSAQTVPGMKTESFLTPWMIWDQSHAKYPLKLPAWNYAWDMRHAYIPENKSLALMAESRWSEDWHASNPTYEYGYTCEPNSTTFFVPTSTVQGGEKITIMTDVAFYTYAGKPGPWGASIFLYDASTPKGTLFSDPNRNDLEFVVDPGQESVGYPNSIWSEAARMINSYGFLGIQLPKVAGFCFDFHHNQMHVIDKDSVVMSEFTWGQTSLDGGVGVGQRPGVWRMARNSNFASSTQISAHSAASGIQFLCPEITNRSQIQFITIKIEVEIVTNKITVSMKPYGGNEFHEYISINTKGMLADFPTQLGVGMSVMNIDGSGNPQNYNRIHHYNNNLGLYSYQTQCEMKNFSIFGGKIKPESTMLLGTHN